MKSAVVISAYNEPMTIREVVERTLQHHQQVIVVDDGSTDDTIEKIADLPVTLLRHKNNRGKAASIWMGVQHALTEGAEAVITLDADLQHRPEHIPELLNTAEQFPETIIIASRTRGRESVPWIRDFANRSANFWISWAAGYAIADTQSGFRLYPEKVFKKTSVPHGRRRGFVFESEILIDSARQGIYSIAIPIDAIYTVSHRASYYRPMADTLKIIRMVAGKLFARGMNIPGFLRSQGVLKSNAPTRKNI